MSCLAAQGELGLCDAELYRVFDAVYDYDLWFLWCATVAGKVPLSRYLEMLQFQDTYLPQHAVKVRFVENHDQMRIMQRAPNRQVAVAWTAFTAFNKGAFMMFSGQALFRSLTGVKKMPAASRGRFRIVSGDGCIVAAWQQPEAASQANLLGIFNVLNDEERSVEVFLPDGEYRDVLGGSAAQVQDSAAGGPATVKVEDGRVCLSARVSALVSVC
eukprot:jgi/Mesen1/9111/ME000058S08609